MKSDIEIAQEAQMVHILSLIHIFSEEEDSYEILTAPDDFEDVRRALEDAGIPMAEASVTMLPQNYVELTAEEDLTNINRILDLLDADDDVQEVFHNWDE